MDDLTEYKRLLCHSMTVLDVRGTQNTFTGEKTNLEWVPIAQNEPCRLSGSPGRIQQLTGRQASIQEFLMHTLYPGLKAGMRLKIEQPEFTGNLYEVGAPYPVYGSATLHHYEVIVQLIDETTGEELEM